MIRTTLAAFPLTLVLPLGAQVSILQNGDFESGPTIPPGQTQVTVTGTQIVGWNIPLGNVDYNAPFWTPSSGSHSVDLHGVKQGAIEQTVSTLLGARYEVMFDLGATGSGSRDVQITAAGQTSPTFSHTGPSFPRISYVLDNRWTFSATGSTTTIRFDSIGQPSGEANGPHIDHIRLFVLSAPASFSTFGTGCQGSAGTPSLSACTGSLPRIGQSFCAELSNVPATGPFPIMLLGFAQQTPPTPLTPIGMTGCVLYVFQPIATGFVTRVGNAAQWSVSIPGDPNLLGASFFNQGLVFDTSANSLGATTSDAGMGVIG